MQRFHFTEKYLSQIPALQLLIGLGYHYLSPKQALIERGNKMGNVLLENILHEQLHHLNKIHHKGCDYLFSEANIQEAVQKLKNVKYDGLLRTNQAVYDLLTLGTSLEQMINGDSKSFSLQYIDWKNWQNNVFHVTAEYTVERSRSLETVRPDIVLFVNGIPFAVIECKAPNVEIEKAVEQSIRNQREDYIPNLFTTVQLVLGINKNAGQYATTGTEEKFWAIWKELEDKDTELMQVINTPLKPQENATLFTGDFSLAKDFFAASQAQGERQITEQDHILYSLCRPERLLDLAYRFTLFDGGIKKIARYQQFFVVRSILARIKQRDYNGNRTGGIVWHTQGSGKSLTMVMLVRALALQSEIKNPRIILVTDRDDLDKQLGNTFAACGLSKERASSGRKLVTHLKNHVNIITTLIHKFDKGWVAEKYVDDSADIFVLVDESHRTNFGTLAARMRQMLPNACYIGFTGTPLLKTEKNNFAKFGGLIEPHYSIQQAVSDKAVVPLLYEGRHVEMQQNQTAIDLWFERHTQGLSTAQKADLKRKYARANMLNKAEQVIYMRAFDISEHYRANWQGRGFKAQLVAPGKAEALKYQEFLNNIGMVSSEVIISAPDMREGHSSIDGESTDQVIKFWHRMMTRFGSEEEYTKQVISQFKNGEEPEILIVVEKLLTGFDAPRNTVLYLCERLKEHTLLQAIARVNRLCEGKEFGYVIDYVNVVGALGEALVMYDAFAGFDAADVADALIAVDVEISTLPQKHSDLWDIFKTIKNQHDEEAFERLLGDEELRKDFYERLAQYAKTLAIALSSDKFLMQTKEALLNTYKQDCLHFEKLRKAVRLRYAETVDYADYEQKIKKLLDTHIQANDILQLNAPVNIFDEKAFLGVKEEHAPYSRASIASQADTIAHETKRTIVEKMDEDPAFYEKFSKLIQQAIDDFRAQRIADLEYLSRVRELTDQVKHHRHDNAPVLIRDNDEACAYYGVIRPYFSDNGALEHGEALAAETALAMQGILRNNAKVDFWHDEDAKKTAINQMDDFFFDELKTKFSVTLTVEQMDSIIEKTLQVARSRAARS